MFLIIIDGFKSFKGGLLLWDIV